MCRLLSVCLMPVVTLFIAAAPTRAAVIYDLSDDFSTTGTSSTGLGPDGVWSFEATNFAPAAPFNSVDTNWWLDTSAPAWIFNSVNDSVPGISKVLDGDENANWDFAIGDVGLHHDGPTGWLNIDWTAPSAMTVDVSGLIWGADFASSGRPQRITVWHLNSAEVIQSTILTATGFNTEDGKAGGVPFSATSLAVATGDIIRVEAYRVGSGSFGALAGLDFTVTVVPEPSSLSLLAFGAASLGLFRRRR